MERKECTQLTQNLSQKSNQCSPKIQKLLAKNKAKKIKHLMERFTMLDELCLFLQKRHIEIRQADDFLDVNLQGNVQYAWYIFFKTKNIFDKLSIIEMLSGNRECYYDLVQLTKKSEKRVAMTLGICDRLGRPIVLLIPKLQVFWYRQKGFLVATDQAYWQNQVLLKIGDMFASRATQDDVFWFWDLVKGKSPLRQLFLEKLYEMPSQQDKVIQYCIKVMEKASEEFAFQKACAEILSKQPKLPASIQKRVSHIMSK